MSMIKRIKKHELHKDAWMTMRLDDVQLPDGSISKYGFIEPQPGSFIMAQDAEGRWLISHEWRYPIEGWTWGWPAGGKEEGESFFECAKREFEEETGRKAGSWTDLGELRSDPGKSSHRVHFFVAQDITHDGVVNRETGEVMEHYWLTQAEIEKRIQSSEFNDGWLLMGWGLLNAHGYLKNISS